MGDLLTSLRALAHSRTRDPCSRSCCWSSTTTCSSRQAWPGWVTGKLSDVAGLVVAPLLLAAALAVVRAPRPMPLVLAATGAGFVFCKSSSWGADVTSSAESLLGTPTMIRADVSDLLALPAMYTAWWTHRSASRADGGGWRRTVSVAVGMAVLPIEATPPRSEPGQYRPTRTPLPPG